MVGSASLFSQLLAQVPRNTFASLVREHGGDRRAKGFSCWAQLTAMLFCQLARADSLREICNGLLNTAHFAKIRSTPGVIYT